MQKSKIEWTDFTVNPVKGLCPVACSYCYARRMYKRFKWNPQIQYDPKAWISGVDINDVKTPSRIFVGSTFELFGDWVKPEWLMDIFKVVRLFPEHTFIFLTKRPDRLSTIRFPDNVWIGVSAVDEKHFLEACQYLSFINAKTKFISFEPLQESVVPKVPIEAHLKTTDIGWVIIGQQTPHSNKTEPNLVWISEIVDAADSINIPVFLKNNLENILPPIAPFVTNPLRGIEFGIRQEFPPYFKMTDKGMVRINQ